MHNIDCAKQNLKWSARAWKDGELQTLALFLFRRAVTQLVFEGISAESRLEVCNSVMTPLVFQDVVAYNDAVENDSVSYAAYCEQSAAMILC